MDGHISISYIIPFYRLERKLLERSVESIANTESGIDWEIIIVDDGTPLSQAEKWIQDFHDSRIKYIYQPNGGPGVARNTGIKAATKNYIQFVDADDYLLGNPYRSCLEILSQELPDILIFDFKKTKKDNISLPAVQTPSFKIYQNGCRYLTSVNLFGTVWSFIFKKDLLSDNLEFFPGIYHEDEDFVLRLFLDAGKIVQTDIVAYAYFQREKSIINNPETAHVKKRFADLLIVLQRMNDWRDRLDGDQRKAVTRRFDQVGLGAVYQVLRDAPDLKTVDAELDRLAELGCWPLPKRQYTRRYTIFRMLTDKRWKTRITRILLKRR